MANDKMQNLRALCEAVSTEQNSERLQALVTELLDKLDESAVPGGNDAAMLTVRT